MQDSNKYQPFQAGAWGLRRRKKSFRRVAHSIFVHYGQRGDVQFAEYITTETSKITNAIPNFYLYVAKTREVIPYSKNSNTTTHKQYIDKYYGR
jgi:beta-xylosidase